MATFLELDGLKYTLFLCHQKCCTSPSPHHHHHPPHVLLSLAIGGLVLSVLLQVLPLLMRAAFHYTTAAPIYTVLPYTVLPLYTILPFTLALRHPLSEQQKE